MTDLATRLTIDRLVLHGIEIPEDDLNRFPDILEAEVKRQLRAGRPTALGVSVSDVAEMRPLVLSRPPDVQQLARELAERIVHAAAEEGVWDA